MGKGLLDTSWSSLSSAAGLGDATGRRKSGGAQAPTRTPRRGSLQYGQAAVTHPHPEALPQNMSGYGSSSGGVGQGEAAASPSMEGGIGSIMTWQQQQEEWERQRRKSTAMGELHSSLSKLYTSLVLSNSRREAHGLSSSSSHHRAPGSGFADMDRHVQQRAVSDDDAFMHRQDGRRGAPRGEKKMKRGEGPAGDAGGRRPYLSSSSSSSTCYPATAGKNARATSWWASVAGTQLSRSWGGSLPTGAYGGGGGTAKGGGGNGDDSAPPPSLGSNGEVVLRGHTDVPTCLTLTMGGKLVTGSSDTTLRVYNPYSWRCERVLRGHTGGVFAVVAAGNRIVTAGWDCRIMVWNPFTWQVDCTLDGSPPPSLLTQSSGLGLNGANGAGVKPIVKSRTNREGTFKSAATGGTRARGIAAVTRSAAALAAFPEPPKEDDLARCRVVAGLRSGDLRSWTICDDEPAFSTKGPSVISAHTNVITTLLVVPLETEGTTTTTTTTSSAASNGRGQHQRRSRVGEEQLEQTSSKQRGRGGLQSSKRQQVLVSTSLDGTVAVWSRFTLKKMACFETGSAVTASAILPPVASAEIADESGDSGCDGNSDRVGVNSGSQGAQVNGEGSKEQSNGDVACQPPASEEGARVALGMSDGRIGLLQIRPRRLGGSVLHKCVATTTDGDCVTGLASTGPRLLVSSTVGGTVRVWDTRTWEAHPCALTTSQPMRTLASLGSGVTPNVTSNCNAGGDGDGDGGGHPSNTRLISAGEDKTVRVWRRLPQFVGHQWDDHENHDRDSDNDDTFYSASRREAHVHTLR